MEEIINLKQEDVDKLITSFPIKPYRSNLIITVNTEEADSDLILSNAQFAEKQFIIAVGGFFDRTSDIRPGKTVLLDLEKMMVFEQADENTHERVGRIKLKPIEVDGRMYAIITDNYILATE